MTPIEKVREMAGIACRPSNVEYDPYLHGMANGLEAALAVLEEREPRYFEAPKRWRAQYMRPWWRRWWG